MVYLETSSQNKICSDINQKIDLTLVKIYTVILDFKVDAS